MLQRVFMSVRKADDSDCERLCLLIEQLGYPVGEAVLKSKLKEYEYSDRDLVLVAEDEGRLMGVIVLHVMSPFHDEGNWGRVSALVVFDKDRGRGVGRVLLKAADDFFLRKGCSRVELTSGDSRTDAHRFYLSNGYEVSGKRFIKFYDG
jgi:GNAT superfamily N-acetyltransferase